MKKYAVLISFGFLLFSIDQALADAARGEKFFNDVQGGNCRTCHLVDDTKLIGPGLGNLMVRHSEEWVRQFITDPQKTWETDHPETIELKKRVRATNRQFARCKKAPMTAEIENDLIEYFKTLKLDAQ
ncbi:MAG: c-type cytochrome [Candidatus Latescibacteria bacterium]|nr:c-type cytochrome [Candidatus Latescibacterota bacterium]NIO77073.1 c-type cytochrome [Candidatus Latescibacterota bacterium]